MITKPKDKNTGVCTETIRRKTGLLRKMQYLFHVYRKS